MLTVLFHLNSIIYVSILNFAAHFCVVNLTDVRGPAGKCTHVSSIIKSAIIMDYGDGNFRSFSSSIISCQLYNAEYLGKKI